MAKNQTNFCMNAKGWGTEFVKLNFKNSFWEARRISIIAGNVLHAKIVSDVRG